MTCENCERLRETILRLEAAELSALAELDDTRADAEHADDHIAECQDALRHYGEEPGPDGSVSYGIHRLYERLLTAGERAEAIAKERDIAREKHESTLRVVGDYERMAERAKADAAALREALDSAINLCEIACANLADAGEKRQADNILDDLHATTRLGRAVIASATPPGAKS